MTVFLCLLVWRANSEVSEWEVRTLKPVGDIKRIYHHQDLINQIVRC